MTGLLAITGIVLVFVASAYSGLSSDDTMDLAPPGLEITPVTDIDAGDSDNATEGENAGEPAGEGEGEGAPPPGATEAPPPPAPTQVANRQDCNQIRGTSYNSPEERTWFLENCVNN